MQPSALKNYLLGEGRMTDMLTNLTVFTLFVYFFGKTVYFALNIGVNISPDEITWLGRSLIFSKFFFLPDNSPETFEHGLITHSPYLYTWVMGKMVHLNFFPLPNLVFLRCVNICIGLATLWFGWKTIALLTSRSVTRLLFLVLCTNTLMLTFLNSFVSYDNLVNFFAVTSLYFLLAYFQNRSIVNFLLYMLFVLAGCLTKLAFLPFAVLVFVVFLFKERKRLSALVMELKSCFLFQNIRRSGLMVLCLFLVALNVNLYLGNIIRFNSLTPSPDAVIGLENAMKNRIFARNYIVRQFKENQVNLMDARRMAVTYIKHEGDLNGTFALLNLTAQQKLRNDDYRIDRFRYFFPWMEMVMAKTYGIMGHKSLEKTGLSLIPYLMILLLAVALTIRHFSLSDMNGQAAVLLVIVAGYTLVIMQYVNYNTYYSSGVTNLALAGRYLFPVIYAGYALVANYLTSFKSARLNTATAVAVAAVFIAGELPWFLSHVTADWYFPG